MFRTRLLFAAQVRKLFLDMRKKVPQNFYCMNRHSSLLQHEIKATVHDITYNEMIVFSRYMQNTWIGTALQRKEGSGDTILFSMPSYTSLMVGLGVPEDIYSSLILNEFTEKDTDRKYYIVIAPVLEHEGSSNLCILLKGSVQSGPCASSICAKLPHTEWHDGDWTNDFAISSAMSMPPCPHWPINEDIPMSIRNSFRIEWSRNETSSDVGSASIMLPAVRMQGKAAEKLVQNEMSEVLKKLTSAWAF